MKNLTTFVETTYMGVSSAQSLAANLASGATCGKFFPHSLVFVSEPNAKGDAKVYNIVANCRQSHINAILKAFIRVYLAVELEINRYKAAAPDKTYANRVVNPLAVVLRCTAFGVTDKNGRLISGSGYCVAPLFGVDNLRKLFAFRDTLAAYKLLAVQGASWDNEDTQKAVSAYIASVDMYVNVLVKLEDIMQSTAISIAREYAVSKKSVEERVKQATDLVTAAKLAYDKAAKGLEAANKAAKDNTNKAKDKELKKAASLAATKAKEAEADLAKKEAFLASLQAEAAEYAEAV